MSSSGDDPDKRLEGLLGNQKISGNSSELLLQQVEESSGDKNSSSPMETEDSIELQSIQNEHQADVPEYMKTAQPQPHARIPGTSQFGMPKQVDLGEVSDWLENNNISSVDQLNRMLTISCEFDALDEKLQRQTVSERKAQESVVFWRLKSEAQEVKIARLENQIGVLERQKAANNLVRGGTRMPNDERNNANFQTSARVCQYLTEPQPQRLSGKQVEFSERDTRERARAYHEATEEMDSVHGGEETLEFERVPQFRANRNDQYINHSQTQHEKDMERRRNNAKCMPEPPKFSAAENTIAVEKFEKMFVAKYGHLETDQQMIILESKFLTGRAEKVFKGLQEKDKFSVQNVLNIIRNRLRISESDESRRGFENFQHLKMKRGQSLDDFCLIIDEVARLAFQSVPDLLVSRYKTSKLLEELREYPEFLHLETSLDTMIQNEPEEKHYDICRSQVTRYEMRHKKSVENQRGDMGIKNNRSNNRFSAQQNSAGNSYQQNVTQQSNNVSGNKRVNSNLPSLFDKDVSQSNNSHSAQRQESTGGIQGNWRNRMSQGGVANNSESEFSCKECNQVGFHEPKCSKAPARRYRDKLRCFRCDGTGHYAHECTNGNPTASAKLDESSQKTNNTDTKEKVAHTISNAPCAAATAEADGIEAKKEQKGVRIVKGRIGVADVDLMLDSGACVSIIGEKHWKEIVQKNGPEWEKRAIVESPQFLTVFAANNEPIKLMFQVKVETSLESRTREVLYHVAQVERDSIILGIDQFETLGISMNIKKEEREIKLAKSVKLYPGAKLFVEIKVEGVIEKDKNNCLLKPMIQWLAPSVCAVSENGKGIVQFSNFGKDTILLEKGQLVATGEVEGFEIIQEKVKSLELLDEYFGVENESELVDRSLCSVIESNNVGDHWTVLCEHLKKEDSTSDAENQVWEIIKSFQHIFAVNDDELGRTNVIECEIELIEGAGAVRQRPRPIPLSIRPEIRKMIQKMLAQGVIRESKSAWASPVVLVKKKDGSVRMCIDYRKVNKLVRYNAHPLPNIEATLQSLSGKKVFTTLDLLAGYWQIPLQEKSKEITAFAIGSELFEWNVLPFGLVTSPAIFQATMESVIGDLLGSCAYVYVDDLLIASESLEQHVIDLKLVLERIERSGMRFRASKCCIAQKQVAYLGHKITPEGVETQETKIEKMKQFPRPTNLKELQSFLGLVGYYRKFILNFSQLASALTPLTSKQNSWKWEKEQEIAFQGLVQAVCSTPVLMQPNTDAAVNGSRPFLIYTDASRQGVGAVLAQEGDDGEQHPIAFASKALTPAETRYHITDLEALGMIFALRRFKTIVYGTQVIVFTDHQPLVYLLKGTQLADRLLRWSIEILEYNVKIVFVNGKANSVADALSRGGCPLISEEQQETEELTKIIGSLSIEKDSSESLDCDKWFEQLREEEGWKEMIQKLEIGESQGKIKIPGVKSEISVENFCLVGNSLRNTELENANRFVVPKKARKKLIEEAHEGLLAGHFGVDKMLRQLSKRFYWPKMRVDIEQMVKSCQKCLCTNDHHKLVAPLTPYVTSRPLEIVACDLIEVGLSTMGNKYILSIIDLFTKYGTAIPIPDKRADTVLKAFVDRWAVGEGRMPETLLTDQGKEFLNEQFKTFTNLMDINHITTKGYNSRANGCIERFNKTIMHIVKKKNTVTFEWDNQIAYAVYAYNAIAHRTTGESPMYLMYGRDAKGGLEKIGDDACGISYADMDEYKNLLTQELAKAHEFVRKHACQEQEEYKHLFDSKHKTTSRKYPQVGSRVLVEIPAEKLGARCPKLVNKWRGPYRVTQCSENSVTVIPVGGNTKEQLKIPYEHVRTIPDEMNDEPIATRKKRAGIKSIDSVRESVTLTEQKDKKESDENDVSFSCMYNCRCGRHCTFINPKKTKIRTTSPTQFTCMMHLYEMGLDENVILALSHQEIPGLTKLPSAATWPILCACPTFSLWKDEIEGFKDAYSLYHSELLVENLGSGLIRAHTKVWAFPGTLPSKVSLTGNVTFWEKEELLNVALIRTRLERATTIVLICPFTTDQEELNEWQSFMAMIPLKIPIILVPGYLQGEKFDELEQFNVPYGRLRRHENGSLTSILLDDKVPSRNNLPLYAVSLMSSVTVHWEMIGELLKIRNTYWPEFCVRKEVKEPAQLEKAEPQIAVKTRMDGDGYGGPIRRENQRKMEFKPMPPHGGFRPAKKFNQPSTSGQRPRK